MRHVATPPLVSSVYGSPPGPWCVRVIYVGVNNKNVSGVSSKFWQITGHGVSPTVEVRWGAIGSKGQRMVTTRVDAQRRLMAKIQKGYTLDDDVETRKRASVVRSDEPKRRSLVDAVASVAWRAVDGFDALLSRAAIDGWVLFDAPDLPDDVRLYVSRSGALFAARIGERVEYAEIRA